MNRSENDLNTTPVLRTNLPAMLTSFIGREQEIAGIQRLLTSARLITLTGAAGCGKTRLALRVAATMSADYLDGAHFVDLGRITDPALVPQVVARTLHIAEQPGHPPMELLLKMLRTRRLLLVLDNCEHVQRTCAQLAQALLTLPHVHIIATSREPLTITGEVLYPVAPMSLPPVNAPEDEMDQFETVRLFEERARMIMPAFAMSAENVATIASICRKIDGIPLAIELASSLVNVLTVEQIDARLDDRFKLLKMTSHVTHNHHNTLRAALDWSHDLLSTAEQTLLRRLSIFAGGCSLASVETICSDDNADHEHVLKLLSALVNKSLVVANTLQRGEARYSLLEIIRQYAHERLIVSGEWSALRDHHLQYFLQITEDTEPKLRGHYQQLWLDWVEVEFANIRAALDWSLKSDHIEVGLRIAIALYQFWTIRDYVEEGFAWFERLLTEADENIPLAVRANALSYAINLAAFRGNTAAVEDYRRDAVALAKAVGDENELALTWALNAQYFAARIAGDHQSEFALAKRLIHIQRQSGNSYLLAVALSTASFSAMSLGQYDEARTMLDESLALLRDLGNPYRLAMALNFSGDLARCTQDYLQAQEAYEESIALLREIDAVRDLASALHNLGHTRLHLGDIERASRLFAESMATHRAQGNAPGIAECLIGFAALATVGGLPDAGARLLSAVVTIGGERVATAWAATRMEYEHYLALARVSLTNEEFHAAQTAGHKLSAEQAVEYATQVMLQAMAAQKPDRKPDDLTPREYEVAALIAQAKSNDDIADELVISKRTVEKHVANIRSKLGFTQRAEIVRWALENRSQARNE